VYIYLDTNLWNALCDKAVHPRKLVAALAAKNANLVLSTHTLYELAKTFGASTEKALERGRELFSYLKEFVDANIPCAKENTELLAAEMWALQLRTPTIKVFLDEADYALLSQEVDRLASGDFGERASKFIRERSEFASNTRSSQVRHLEGRADMKQNLKNVSPEALEHWLRTETLSPIGAAILTDHIVKQFPEAPQKEAIEYASALLVSRASRMAKGLVRADLYYNWRCAYRDSIPRDLIDDIYHVLNAAHCDVYATAESRQAEYAGLLLTADTSVAIYDGVTPVDRWLGALA
jgi:hypothetical protein